MLLQSGTQRTVPLIGLNVGAVRQPLRSPREDVCALPEESLTPVFIIRHMADILVIDDDRCYRSSITRALTDAGHRVYQAEDGRAGHALCRRVRPALVITTMVMPEKDGIEIVRELSREMPDLPILAITGVAKAALYLRAAKVFGAAACLQKPFGANELLNAVALLLACGGNQQRNEHSPPRSGRRRYRRSE